MKATIGLSPLHAGHVAKVAARPAPGLVDLTRRLTDGIASWNRRHVEASELRRLDDRLLDDIGLTRADLDRAA